VNVIFSSRQKQSNLYVDGVSTTKRFCTAKRQKLKLHIFAKLRSKKEAYVKDFTVLYIVLCVLQTNQKGFQDLEADWAPWRADCLFIFI